MEKQSMTRAAGADPVSAESSSVVRQPEEELPARIEPPHVVIVGGGFAGLAAAQRLGSKAVRVTLYDRRNHHLFQPLLYQVALASLGESDIAVPIRSVLRQHANIEVELGEVRDIELANGRIRLEDGGEEYFDYLILAAGALTNYYGHAEWEEWALGLKSLDDAAEIRRRVLLAFEAAERAQSPTERERLLTFAIIGAGPTGVELAGAISDLSRDILGPEYRHLSSERTRVVLLEVGQRVLPPMHPELSERAAEQLRGMGVTVRTGVNVSRIDESGVWLGDELIAAGTVLWGAGVTPSPLARALGVALERDGRVRVQNDCSLPGFPNIFVVGDLAAFTPEGSERPLPGLSPVALQQGRSTAANILRDVEGEPRKPFRYDDRGFMATIGRARAVAEIKGVRLSGFLAWLAWVVVHLWYLAGFRNRISVFLNWIWAYLMAKHGARIVTGPSQVRSKDLSAVTDARRAEEHSPRGADGSAPRAFHAPAEPASLLRHQQ
jgi:NADH dehydrogenase